MWKSNNENRLNLNPVDSWAEKWTFDSSYEGEKYLHGFEQIYTMKYEWSICDLDKMN